MESTFRDYCWLDADLAHALQHSHGFGSPGVGGRHDVGRGSREPLPTREEALLDVFHLGFKPGCFGERSRSKGFKPLLIANPVYLFYFCSMKIIKEASGWVFSEAVMIANRENDDVVIELHQEQEFTRTLLSKMQMHDAVTRKNRVRWVVVVDAASIRPLWQRPALSDRINDVEHVVLQVRLSTIVGFRIVKGGDNNF
ncbi:hypothetical protein DB728_30230 [Rhizobium leguminosarum bv. viciae USDA 2370]|nr:hypothetical protein BS629_20965 [Rhizobium leguminosarum bv. viciae USDA 2370]PUB60968.1 hypothetical protein DB728_30230 [Rhizobium leguminosarum bv. viciae USDA 2370]